MARLFFPGGGGGMVSGFAFWFWFTPKRGSLRTRHAQVEKGGRFQQGLGPAPRLLAGSACQRPLRDSPARHFPPPSKT